MEQDLTAILEQQLKGLHMPEAVSWWPLAPGWWVLSIVIFCLLVFVSYSFIRHRQRNLYRAQAIQELKAAHNEWLNRPDNSRYVQSANAILKRSILAAGGHNQLASLSGQAFIDELNSWSKQPLSEQNTTTLASAGYMNQPAVNIEDLHQQLCNWLSDHKKPIAVEASHA